MSAYTPPGSGAASISGRIIIRRSGVRVPPPLPKSPKYLILKKKISAIEARLTRTPDAWRSFCARATGDEDENQGEHVSHYGAGPSALLALMAPSSRSMRPRRTRLQFSRRHAANVSVRIFSSILVRLQDARLPATTYGSSCPIEKCSALVAHDFKCAQISFLSRRCHDSIAAHWADRAGPRAIGKGLEVHGQARYPAGPTDYGLHERDPVRQI